MKLVRKVRELGRGGWFFIDLTHGINYQTVIVLYASLTAITQVLGAKGMLRTFILNSEPIPPLKGLEVCIEAKPSTEIAKELPSLGILGISDMVKIHKLVLAVTALPRLEVSWIKEGLGELITYLPRDVVDILTKYLLPSINAIKIGAPVPIFIGSEYSLGTEDLRLCKCSERLSSSGVVDEELIPKISHEEHVVKYDDVSAWVIIGEAIRDVIDKLCKDYRLGAEDLMEFLEGVSKLYENVGLINLKYLIDQLRSELGVIKTLWSGLSGDVVIPTEVYYTLWSLMKKTKPSLKELEKIVEEAHELLTKKPIPRNFVAHGGLEFRSLEKNSHK